LDWIQSALSGAGSLASSFTVFVFVNW